ncbi:MAG TPA: AMP nucleosidase [Candidatus Limnocylindria bacterium]|nr:AMP nucleosidase [Candidatus Limnocylindria bacterium]
MSYDPVETTNTAAVDAPTFLTPEAAVDRLGEIYDTACQALRAALKRYADHRVPPTAEERLAFRYPALQVTWEPCGMPHFTRRAWAKFQTPGVYTTTVTQPRAFRSYLLDQLRPLVDEFGATIEVGQSDQEIPYPYVTERGDEFIHGEIQVTELARYFPTPVLAAVGDEIADGTWTFKAGRPRPLALFDAVRTDFSLKRLSHYTGTHWSTVQPWILLTNYQRYVDQFVQRALAELAHPHSSYAALSLPGGGVITRETNELDARAMIADAPWHNFQMPAYSLARKDGQGVTIINIGVGPSNAKNITDHLAVLRPNCWLMIGHCGGLRQSQLLGDYVLAHGYLRRDQILDDLVPPEIPIPALAEVQVALQEAAERVTGDRGDALKRRLRTGTVVTYADRNWELRFGQERRRINLARAVAVDMESGTLAAQGYRLRVPYGTLLCVSDKPLHGEIKLPGAATAFYQRAVGEHLAIGLETVDLLRGQLASLHSRKLRSFDEPVFR